MRTNKSTILTVALILLTVVSFTSCKKFLVEEPVNSTYSEAFWKSSRDLESALAGNYALVRAALSSGSFNTSPRYYMYGDAVAKHYFTMQYAGDGLEGIQNGDYTFQYNIESLANWTVFYKAITMSNILLNRVPKVDDALLSDVVNPTEFKNEILGEAYFLRALTYFMMVRVWGDVPIVTEEYDDPISAPELARDAKADVLKLIEEDAKKALDLLPWNYRSNSDAKVTANKGSVYALLAHMYLWRATTTDVTTDQPIMSDVDLADNAITQILGSGLYSLVDTAQYHTIFEGRSRESIFELSMSEASKEGSNAHIANMFLRTSHIAYVGTNSRNFVTQEYLSNHFSRVEDVWDWYWINNGWVWTSMPSKKMDGSDLRFRNNFTDIATNAPGCIKYRNVVYRNPSQERDAYISNNMIIFRLSDMQLLKAEIALYRDNVNGAVEIINNSRRRYNAHSSNILAATGLSKSTVMYEYMLERGKEMYLEGHLMYDLIRTRQYTNFVGWLSESRFRQEGFYWPVYPGLFKNNNKLVQTSYWRGKV